MFSRQSGATCRGCPLPAAIPALCFSIPLGKAPLWESWGFTWVRMMLQAVETVVIRPPEVSSFTDCSHRVWISHGCGFGLARVWGRGFGLSSSCQAFGCVKLCRFSRMCVCRM